MTISNAQLRQHATKVYIALMRCWDMWQELAENPGMQKYQTKSYRKYGTDCFACAISPRCAKCIMLELWPNTCIYSDSPYQLWDTYIDQAANAKIIADFAFNKAQHIKALHNITVDWR